MELDESNRHNASITKVVNTAQKNDLFLKWKVIGDEIWRKRTWWKSNEPPQTVPEPGLMGSDVFVRNYLLWVVCLSLNV